jgi:hypothetical protein
VVEESVAELEPSLDYRRPGLGTALTVDPQTPAVLESLDSSAGPWSEDPGSVRGNVHPEGRKTFLKIDYSGTRVPATKRKTLIGLSTYDRYGESSWRSCALPRAPVIRSLGSPSLKRINVGMLITSKRRVTSRFSSMLSFAT